MGLAAFPQRALRGSQSVKYELGLTLKGQSQCKFKRTWGGDAPASLPYKLAYIKVHKVSFKSTLGNPDPILGLALLVEPMTNSPWRWPNVYSTFASRRHPFPERHSLNANKLGPQQLTAHRRR